jgi:hypothetical protein
MRPTIKQLEDLRTKIASAQESKGLSYAELGRISLVHPSQVSRICGGQFATFSHNVVQVCKALDIKVPQLEPKHAPMAPEWAQVISSMRKIWDDTPEGAQAISRMLDAIADLQARAS